MTCHYCRSVNADDDHRCRRCGRRLMGTAVEAPPEHARRALKAVGANALAAATAEMTRPDFQTSTRLLARSAQPSLFVDEPRPKVVPFAAPENRQQGAAGAFADTEEIFAPRPAKARSAAKKATLENAQSKLDFLPPAPQTAKLLKTTVEASVRCDLYVANPIHRATAAGLDAALIVAAFGVFYGLFWAIAGPVTWNKQTAPIFAGAFALIGLFYGFLWVLADSESAGLQWAGLKLVTFNGFPLERGTRALRMLGFTLSVCSGFIGILWSLVDEEGLTWHDHMSKTFPTTRETASRFVRQK